MSRSPCNLAAHWERFAVEWLEPGTLLRSRLMRRGLAPMALSGLPGWETHFAMRCLPGARSTGSFNDVVCFSSCKVGRSGKGGNSGSCMPRPTNSSGA